VDEEQAAASLGARQQGSKPPQGVAISQRAGGQGDARATPPQDRVHVNGIEMVESYRAPGSKPLGEGVYSLQVGLDQLERSGAGERLDPERTGDGDDRAVNAVLRQQTGPPAAHLLHGVDRKGLLARGMDDGLARRAPGEGQAGATLEPFEQRPRVDVLVEIDAQGAYYI
jgi:hypothetical protein